MQSPQRYFFSGGLAIAHTENGGTGNDTILGHDAHSDNLNGGPGCDTVKGLGKPDLVQGGNGGCDGVFGGPGWDDDVVVWDDGLPNDNAAGGDGNGDICYINFTGSWMPADTFDNTREAVVVP